MAFENASFAAEIPADLLLADDMLTRYGRWATSYGARKGAFRRYCAEVHRSKYRTYRVDFGGEAGKPQEIEQLEAP